MHKASSSQSFGLGQIRDMTVGLPRVTPKRVLHMLSIQGSHTHSENKPTRLNLILRVNKLGMFPKNKSLVPFGP